MTLLAANPSTPALHRMRAFTPGRIFAWLALGAMLTITLAPLWMVVLRQPMAVLLTSIRRHSVD